METVNFAPKRILKGKTVKAWRLEHQLSAHQLAQRLGVSRSYIKSIEGGSLAASQKIIRRFDELRANTGEVVESPSEPKQVNIICRFDLPSSIEILARPRRCKGCHKWFVPVTPNQKIHNNAQCKRAARKHRHTARRKGKAQ